MSWSALEIGQLVNKGDADIQTGPFGTQLKASDYVEHGVPVINVRNIGYSDLRPEKIEYIMESKSEQLGVHKLENNDIVFGRKGAVDRHLYVKNEQVGWIQGSDCIRLRFSSEEINPRFVSYSFLSSYHKQWMLNQCGNKATMASLNQDVVKRISIKLPSKTHQDIIVEVLQKYDDLIENNKRRIELLEESARQLYKEWFVRFRFPGHEHVKIVGGMPEGWESCPASDALHVNPRVSVEKGKEIVCVPMASLSESQMTVDKSAFEQRTNHTSVKFMRGDTLFARITPCLENGKTAFVYFLEEGEIACGSTEFVVFRGKKVSNQFTYLLAREESFRGNAIKSMIGSSGRQRVQPSCFDKYIVPIAPDYIQEQFDSMVSSAFEQIAVLAKQNEQLARARDLLLPKLMSGEIAV